MMTWSQIRKVLLNRSQRMKTHVQKEAGRELPGPELVMFTIGLVGQKLLDDIGQVLNLSTRIVNLSIKAVWVAGIVGLAITLMLSRFLGDI